MELGPYYAGIRQNCIVVDRPPSAEVGLGEMRSEGRCLKHRRQHRPSLIKSRIRLLFIDDEARLHNYCGILGGTL